MAFGEVFGVSALAVALEGHGREEILPDLNISRTVGWFTTMYPVVLNAGPERDLSGRIIDTKECLRSIPNKGSGYLILKHLTDPVHRQDVGFTLRPQVAFNYLGQFDSDVANASFTVAREPMGRQKSDQVGSLHDFEVKAVVAGGNFSLSVTYNAGHFRPATIERLGKSYQQALRAVVDHCTRQENSVPTPSDFDVKELSITDLETLFE
jgi:non-ribosomal peptide synthase protein (TIGR01720 family)